MAAKSKLTPEVTEKIFQLIRAGNTIELSAAAAGISESTFYSWMERGLSSAESNAAYREFREQVEQARAESEAVLVTRIAKAAASGSWRAATWLLERRHPERWASVTERTTSVEEGKGRPIEEDDPIERARADIAKRRGSQPA